MSIDRGHIGTTKPPLTLHVDAGRLRFFAKATGQTDPIYTDEEQARAAGHRALPVPPTFFFGIAMEAKDPFGWMSELGVDLGAVLHGTQSFTYHQMAYAGDTLTLQQRITDIYEKKGGRLEFIVQESVVTNLDGDKVATLTGTTVVQHKEASA